MLPEKQQLHKYVITEGHSKTLGATIEKDGVNFAVWCPAASIIELLLFKDIDDCEPDIITLASPLFRSTYYWHVKVKGIKAGQIYAWRIKEALRTYKFAQSHVELGKVLLDPYGKRVLFPKAYRRFQTDDPQENLKISAKSAVVDLDDYDWELDVSPRHPLNRTIIYEMHVKGFTAHQSSNLPPQLRGTYRGLIEKIPYLVDLGITAVEFLPIFQYDSDDALPGKKNYWGYCPMAFFAPHEAYAQDKSLMGPLNEFRDLVKALHRNGIEVILDVVYNHTSEGDQNGPVYCFKGFDKQSYYIIDDHGNYGNYSGCGNTFNTNNSVVRNLIIDSLIFWKEEMHIDGFRFDLASILSRDEQGRPIANAPTLLDIDINPRLADTKIIAEPWDAGGLYQVGNIAGSKWREWNGKFRDTVRAFMRGDPGNIKDFVTKLLGSPDIYNEKIIDPQKSVNFITCHDGFTLWDLVAYSHKHNEANGENGRDGCNNNYSANYGVEGESDDTGLNELRLRQAKNMMALTLISLGTSMITMGDEVLRTQRGNNNAYCQDNDTSYMNWNFTEHQLEMHNFTRRLIHYRTIRTKHRSRNNGPQIKMLDSVLRSTKLQWHGVKPYQPDWSDHSHSIGLIYYWGTYNVFTYIFVNAYWQDLEVELPPVPGYVNRHWYRLIDTSLPAPNEIKSFLTNDKHSAGEIMKIKARSIVMMISSAF